MRLILLLTASLLLVACASQDQIDADNAKSCTWYGANCPKKVSAACSFWGRCDPPPKSAACAMWGNCPETQKSAACAMWGNCP